MKLLTSAIKNVRFEEVLPPIRSPTSHYTQRESNFKRSSAGKSGGIWTWDKVELIRETREAGEIHVHVITNLGSRPREPTQSQGKRRSPKRQQKNVHKVQIHLRPGDLAHVSFMKRSKLSSKVSLISYFRYFSRFRVYTRVFPFFFLFRFAA